MLGPYSDVAGTGGVPLARYAGTRSSPDVGPDAAALLAWARRLAATEVEVQSIGLTVRAAAADVARPDPVGDALTELVHRTAGEVASLANRVGRAARLMAAESMRSAR